MSIKGIEKQINELKIERSNAWKRGKSERDNNVIQNLHSRINTLNV